MGRGVCVCEYVCMHILLYSNMHQHIMYEAMKIILTETVKKKNGRPGYTEIEFELMFYNQTIFT